METYHETEDTPSNPESSLGDQSEQTRANEKAKEPREDPGMAQRSWTKRGRAGEIAGGLLEAVCELGLRVIHEIFEEEVTDEVGPKGKHNGGRTAVRHGDDDGEVTLGGRRIQIRRPRMRLLGGGEIPLATYRWATGRNILNQMTYQRVVSGVSMRNYPLTLEPVSARSAHRPRSISKSSVSRRFIAMTKNALDELTSRNLRELKPVVLMIDGLHVAGQMLIAAMVIDIDGRKHPVALRAGVTENAGVVKQLLTDLKDRGLDSSHGLLVVIDGSKALAAAVRQTFGDQALIQRCTEHKVRNVEDHLHEEQSSWVTRVMRKAYKRTDPALARRDLEALARRLDDINIDAANSLREGMDETLTIHGLGVGQMLARTVRTTNALESMNEIIRTRTRNVKRWQGGDMRQRWVAAAMLEAESQFKRVQGWKELPALARALYQATVLKQDRTGGTQTEIAA
jgi:putative transposase